MVLMPRNGQIKEDVSWTLGRAGGGLESRGFSTSEEQQNGEVRASKEQRKSRHPMSPQRGPLGRQERGETDPGKCLELAKVC